MKARACSSKSRSAATRPSGDGRCRSSKGISAKLFSLDDILPHVHKVERGLIRVDADEVTYPLHVILRFELEQDLVAGRLEVADIPEAWDAKMRDYLGLSTIDTPGDGPMQDVHWPGGTFGYFPSYTLGAMMAAQQWAAIAEEFPAIETEIANGKFDTVNEWRRAKDLVAGLAPFDAGTAGARDRRAAQRRSFHRAPEEALRTLAMFV